MRDDLLFANDDLDSWLRQRKQEALDYVSQLDPERILVEPEIDLLQDLFDRFKAEPPTLNLDNKFSPGTKDVQIDVSRDPSRYIAQSGPVYASGTRYEVWIPILGNAKLLFLKPSLWSTSFPRGKVHDNHLVVWYEAPSDSLTGERVEQEINSTINLITQYLDATTRDCGKFNQDLQDRLRSKIEQRKLKILNDRKIEAYMKIPIRRRPDASPIFTVSIERLVRQKQRSHKPPRGASEPFVPEPAISDEDYRQILKTIKSYRDLVERLPSTFRCMEEETLRDVLLVVLNNQFGPVGGEVFSRKGKTDIFVWHNSGAVFIAECKFWRGKKYFKGAIDQLLGYLTWRDTKSCLILFVREQNVSDVISKAKDAISSHPQFKRWDATIGDFPVFVLHHEGDRAREIKVALVVVALPA